MDMIKEMMVYMKQMKKIKMQEKGGRISGYVCLERKVMAQEKKLG